jgi:peptide/nickel transport system ATP-binding protein
VCIAVALAGQPVLLVLDEPTTGLDVVTQARVLEEIVRLRDDEGVSMLYVTHDLAVIAQIADRIAVMYAGRIVEQGRADEVLRRPRHPYTKGLIESIPDHLQRRRLKPMVGVAAGVGHHPVGCAFAPRCPQRTERCEEQMPELEEIVAQHYVRCLHWDRTGVPDSVSGSEALPRLREPREALLEVRRLHAEHRMKGGTVTAVEDVSFTLHLGERLALIGESGSGKTTIARAIVGLHPSMKGEVLVDGQVLSPVARERTAEQRRRIQLIFQSPLDALNPRHRVSDAIARPAQALRGLSRANAERQVYELLEVVRLPARIADRYPREISGGEAQRVAIARALAAQPEVLVCDEVTSALDVSVQAAVLALLEELCEQLGVSLIFISHDLGVVACVAEYVLVVERGAVVEEGPTERLLRAPTQPYTQQLLSTAPSLTDAVATWERRDLGLGSDGLHQSADQREGSWPT